ncbi:hypothetical protein MJ579_05440 [Klebsiella pneumoniae]|nr:hypothetical protein MJ579_05440 [Klebsiella pneumoniae]
MISPIGRPVIAAQQRGSATPAPTPSARLGVALADAHWVDKTTLLWPVGKINPLCALYYSHSSKVAADSNGEFSDTGVKLTPPPSASR